MSGSGVYSYPSTHTQSNTTTGNCSVSSQLSYYNTGGGRWKRVEGGQSGARQQAENLSHRHLTKSCWSPFSCRQKKNRSDGQAEQNEVKVILLNTGDRYSHSACMWTCVWMHLSSLPGMSISRKMKLQRPGRWAGLSTQWYTSSRTCLRVCTSSLKCVCACTNDAA